MPLALPITVPLLLLAPEPLPSIDELVGKLHAPRAGIVHYEVVIDARQADGFPRPSLRRVWRDGARYREDRLSKFTENGSARSIDCTNCPEVGKYFAVRYDAVFQRSKAAALMPLHTRRAVGGDRRFRFEDLGATPETVGNQAHERGLDWYTGREEWTEKRVERSRWKDLPAYKIVLAAPNHPTKATFEATLVPDRGFAAVHARTEWDERETREIRTSESELARITGIWLPTTSVYCEYTGDKRKAKLTQKIEYVKLNAAPDPKVFTLPGMDLIPGTLVGTEKGGIFSWDGTKLGPATSLRFLPPESNEPAAEQRRSGLRRLLLLALAGAALLTCGFFVTRLVRSFRSGRRPTPLAGAARPGGTPGPTAAASSAGPTENERP